MMQQKCHFDEHGASPMTGPHATVRERPVRPCFGWLLTLNLQKVRVGFPAAEMWGFFRLKATA